MESYAESEELVDLDRAKNFHSLKVSQLTHMEFSFLLDTEVISKCSSKIMWLICIFIVEAPPDTDH